MTEGSGGLLGAELVSELDRLRRRLASRTDTAAPGQRGGRRRGGTAEFVEHRDYGPGDDVRHIDWFSYARSLEPKIKVYRQDDDLHVRLALDASASMAFGEPTKLAFGRRVAAALAYIALTSSERAQVHALTGDGPDASGTTVSGGPRRGRSGLGPMLAELERIEAAGRMSLSTRLTRLLAEARRPGLLFVASDFLETGNAVARALTAARVAGHELSVLHVQSREELFPTLEGDVTLVDAETGRELSLTADSAALVEYERQVEAHARQVAQAVRKIGGLYVRALSDGSVIGVVRALLGGQDTGGRLLP